MSNKYLNEAALTQLINNIQNQTIKSYEYTEIPGAITENIEEFLVSAATFLKITAAPQQAWQCNLKITTQTNDSNSLQVVNTKLIGMGTTVTSWETSNIIYDIARQKANSLIIINDDSNLYIGLKFNPKIDEKHTVIIDINGKTNCTLTILKNPKWFNTHPDEVTYQIIDITNNGTYSQAMEELQDNLAEVAKSGSYYDLIDRPSLLNVTEDEINENLIFAYN